MKTMTELTPRHHGRRMSDDEFAAAEAREGYRFELIDGKVFMCPAPGTLHAVIVAWFVRHLENYWALRPDVIQQVTSPGRIFVPGRKLTTCPEPDVAVFSMFPPVEFGLRADWREAVPLIVVEVISPDSYDKDAVRNYKLYKQVPSIREYWLMDPGDPEDGPLLQVFRKRGRQWAVPIECRAGDVYTTPVLPEFRLTVDPSRYRIPIRFGE